MRKRTTIDVGYYAIKGETWRDLDRAIRSKGPVVNKRHALAAAQIRLKPDLSFFNSEAGCEITSVRIYVDAKVKLPKWINEKKGNKPLRKSWGRYSAYAAEHEATHVKIAEQHARQAEITLLSLPQMRSCEELKIRYAIVMNEMHKMHQKAQAKFDENERKRIANLTAEAERSQFKTALQ